MTLNSVLIFIELGTMIELQGRGGKVIKISVFINKAFRRVVTIDQIFPFGNEGGLVGIDIGFCVFG